MIGTSKGFEEIQVSGLFLEALIRSSRG